MECCLTKGELLRVDGGKSGLVLRCTCGSIWLTCGDGADYLLSSGQSYAVPIRRIAIIEALAAAEFYLGEPVAAGELVQRRFFGVTAC
jgi:hypothetical protein